MTADPAATAPARRRWRTVDGIALLDKPRGLTSTQALQRVRRLLGAEKAGHAGTLDPMATGMLPLCFGQATKACGALLGQRKAYRATVRLGVATDTADAEGRVIGEAEVPRVSPERLREVLASLTGARSQVPPMYSALKRQGRPLYELARRGEEVERAARPVTIDAIELLHADEATLGIEVTCSKGTYIRVLAEEIAAGLATVGHLTELRRLWVEPFDARQMVTLEQIEAEASWTDRAPPWLLAADRAFPALPAIHLDAAQALHLCQGRTLDAPPELEGSTGARVYDPSGTFLGLVERGPDGRLRVQRLFVAGAGSLKA